MLNLINNIKLLEPFFEDCYLEMGVREYSRKTKLTPPTASSLLKELEKEGLLKSRKDRRYLLFRANRESSILKDLSRIYWKLKFNKLIALLEKEFMPSAIILFGSLSKLEAKDDSDIDICIISDLKKHPNLKHLEKEYKREIQFFIFDSINNINKELKDNILNGYVLKGMI